jgi:hypothetical protein
LRSEIELLKQGRTSFIVVQSEQLAQNTKGRFVIKVSYMTEKCMTSSRDLDLGSDRDIDQQAQILLVGNETLTSG